MGGDNSALEELGGLISHGAVLTRNDIEMAVEGYFHDNFSYRITCSLLTVGPSIIYLVYRMTKGLRRALKGHRVGAKASIF